jgi:hypothetical protein
MRLHKFIYYFISVYHHYSCDWGILYIQLSLCLSVTCGRSVVLISFGFFNFLHQQSSCVNVHQWLVAGLTHDLCWWRKLKNQVKSKLPTCHKSPMNINTWALLVEEIEEPKENQNYRPATSHRWTLTHDLCWWRKLKNRSVVWFSLVLQLPPPTKVMY